MATSLLHAVGLSELVTETAEDYEALAIALALDPQRLQALRERLAANRMTTPLFDTARLTRDIEKLYLTMVQRLRDGLPAENIGPLAPDRAVNSTSATGAL